MNKSQAGRLGGLETFRRRGSRWMRRIGRLGGLAFAARYLMRGYGGMYNGGRVDWSASVPDSVYDDLRHDEPGANERSEEFRHPWRSHRHRQ